METPSDTCRRLSTQLGHWLDWIDGHTDLQAAWQLYDDILQNRRTSAEAQRRPQLDAQYNEAGGASEDNLVERTQVLCAVEGMNDTREDITFSDFLVVKMFGGAVVLLVLFESITTIWW